MDRNYKIEISATIAAASLSARRAWIEIYKNHHPLESGKVALRKESVDRNRNNMCIRQRNVRSLSARRAWIEIYTRLAITLKVTVALRKESVDRNFIELSPWGAGGASLSARRAWIEIGDYVQYSYNDNCRSPQGERG